MPAKAWPRWFGWSPRAERWPPMPGTCRAVDFPCNQSRLKCSPWVFPHFAHPTPRFQELKRFKGYGRTPVSTKSKRGESTCNGHSPISTSFGRRPCWHLVLARQSLRCHRMMRNCSKSACARACRRMPRAASPTVHGQMRLRVTCQVEASVARDSSFQIHISSLHCFSYADALHERQRAWRETGTSNHFKEDLRWPGCSCSLLACAKSPGRSASNTRKDSRPCYPRL